MNPSDLTVFVYGTLKPGGCYWPEFCKGRVGVPIPAKIRGELYDLHLGYPGLRLEANHASRSATDGDHSVNSSSVSRHSKLQETGWVYGCLLDFRSEQDLIRLDELEGFSSGRLYSENEYVRIKVPAYDLKGLALGEAWTYVITETRLAQCKGSLIPEGEWSIQC